MASEEAKIKKKGGCFGRLVTLFTFFGLALVGAGVFFMVQAQDLSDVEGRGPTEVSNKARDLKEVLRNSSERGYALTLRESEINRYLAQTLKGKQTGPLADKVSLREVLVRLETDRAEVVMVREVVGLPITVSMYLRVEQLENPDGSVSTQIHRDGGPYHDEVPNPVIGGRFGRVPVPQGFLYLVLPSFESLARQFRTPSDPSSGGRIIPEKEMDFIEDMARIRMEEGKLILDPNGEQGMLPAPAR